VLSKVKRIEMVRVLIKNLTKKYGDVQALKDLSLSIEDKEFFILLGPSGCGKSTALLCIAGLLMPDSGEIWFDNKLVTSPQGDVSLPPQERQVAMVFQDYALYPHMTVFKNIAFPLEVRGESTIEISQRVNTTADLLGIRQLLDRKPKQLSGGQRQRVALGRAIIREPKIFLMDEPLANLDAKLRVYMRVELKKLHQKLETTSVYVTHDQVEAMSLGDRVAVLKDGILQQIATPSELYDAPKNVFVAGFIGSPPMNMLSGRLFEKNESFKIELAKKTFNVDTSKIEGRIIFCAFKDLGGSEEEFSWANVVKALDKHGWLVADEELSAALTSLLDNAQLIRNREKYSLPREAVFIDDEPTKSKLVRVLSTFELPSAIREKVKGKNTSEVVLGFRPEHVVLSKKAQDNALEANVEMMESIGREIHVHLTFGDYPIVAVTTSFENAMIGETVWIVPVEEKIHLFDGKTGEALI
jgi:multiple sugar transport system ATP-binding protein